MGMHERDGRRSAWFVVLSWASLVAASTFVIALSLGMWSAEPGQDPAYADPSPTGQVETPRDDMRHAKTAPTVTRSPEKAVQPTMYVTVTTSPRPVPTVTVTATAPTSTATAVSRPRTCKSPRPPEDQGAGG